MWQQLHDGALRQPAGVPTSLGRERPGRGGGGGGAGGGRGRAHAGAHQPRGLRQRREGDRRGRVDWQVSGFIVSHWFFTFFQHTAWEAWMPLTSWTLILLYFMLLRIRSCKNLRTNNKQLSVWAQLWNKKKNRVKLFLFYCACTYFDTYWCFDTAIAYIMTLKELIVTETSWRARPLAPVDWGMSSICSYRLWWS